MIRFISILALVSLFSFVACSPEDIPLPVPGPDNPVAAQADADQDLLLYPKYEGDETSNRIRRCRYAGTILDFRGEGNCGFVIRLRNGSLVAPINSGKLPVKLRHGMNVMVGFKYLREIPDGACQLAEPVFVNCITPLRGLGRSTDGVRVDD